MRKTMMILVTLIAATMSTMSFAQSSGFQKLDEWTEVWKNGQQTYFGYPANQHSPLYDFYEWYLASGMDVVPGI